MRVLLVSTLKRKVAKDISASRCRIIYQLGKGLVDKGHQVSLLGTADSLIEGATTIPLIEKAFVDLPPAENQFYAETSYLLQLEKKIEELAGNFDVIHNHTFPEFINLYASERITTPMVTTLHAQATPEYDAALGLFPKSNLVSISKAHKSKFKKAHINWIVYNGVDTTIYAFQEQKQDHLLWLGRLGKAKDKDGNFMDAKGVKWAIQLAEETGQKLVISGNVEDMAFYEKEVKPHLNEKIQWYGPVTNEQVLKREEVVKLMQDTKAFLMTINWEEPFGLVMAEAMSCGTPVIAFNRGSVSEVVVNNVTGFVIDPEQGIEGLKTAVSQLGNISPKACREHVEQHFSLEKMVENYLSVYNQLQNKQ